MTDQLYLYLTEGMRELVRHALRCTDCRAHLRAMLRAPLLAAKTEHLLAIERHVRLESRPWTQRRRLRS